MSSPIRTFFEIIWLYCKGFRPVEFVRDDDRISLHPSGWRVNGSGRLKRAKDAVDYLESATPEQWRQIYCGMTPFLVSDKGNVKHVDGNPVKMTLANGRYQIMYKPEDSRGRGKDGRIHKKRVYRSMLVAMAWLDFRKGDTEHEIHHINGYRTDDRVANLMIVDHEEHLRIHGLGPCALSGLPDERIVDAPAGCESDGEEPETFAGAHVALKPEKENDGGEPRKKKRRRGKRGGKGRSNAQANQDAREGDIAHDEHAGTQDELRLDDERGATAPRKNAEETQEDAERRETTHGEQSATASSENVDAHDAGASRASDDASGEGAKRNRRGKRSKNRGAAQPAENAKATEGAMQTAESAHEADGARENARASQGEPAAENPAQHGKAPSNNAGEPKRAASERGGKNDGSANADRIVDWTVSRKRLAENLDAFLETVQADNAEHAIDEKEASKAAKPVYKALKPFLTCPDAVTAFDASLASIRTIVQAYRDSGASIPAPVHSMLGTLHQVVKDSVKRIAAEGDAVETACLRELLIDEAAKPLFKKTVHARKFRQCISVVDSRNETESKRA